MEIIVSLSRLSDHLKNIYGEEASRELLKQIESKTAQYRDDIHCGKARYSLNQEDVVLITYGDQFSEPGQKPLETLHAFCQQFLGLAFNTIHILPFFPYSSDDGFSVIDYYHVDPALGDWADIQAISGDFRLMVDGVFNHASKESSWFKGFLAGEQPYCNYFISVAPRTDLSQVVRPRALPLLTAFQTGEGQKLVWTTFSDDQVDLNYASPDVFLEITDVMLTYVKKGARIIRIDAVPFLWKEIGTDCIHRPQTHALVKAWRAILDLVAPEVLLITESNVPFEDNISYLGEYKDHNRVETDEAQLVYQFSLGPLILHTFLDGNSSRISRWVSSLPQPYRYFNFIASHDGIGLNPATGILDQDEINALIKTAQAHGGRLSYKKDVDGNEKVYELNITLYDFLNDPQQPQAELDIERFIASQAIMLVLAGVPGIYVHSLFGSHNCLMCDEDGQHPRSINRAKFNYSQLLAKLADPTSRETVIFHRYLALLAQRRMHAAFAPFAEQEVLLLDERVFALYREDERHAEQIVCITNVTDKIVEVKIPASQWLCKNRVLKDLLSDHLVAMNDDLLEITLQPYQSMWLCSQV
ncbi:MAG TPA: sugar phosphorylase [Anaerolineaceae bacterium]|nr:sugar phosphorylase [Anaerolineaceae bacterium]